MDRRNFLKGVAIAPVGIVAGGALMPASEVSAQSHYHRGRWLLDVSRDHKLPDCYKTSDCRRAFKAFRECPEGKYITFAVDNRREAVEMLRKCNWLGHFFSGPPHTPLDRWAAIGEWEWTYDIIEDNLLHTLPRIRYYPRFWRIRKS